MSINYCLMQANKFSCRLPGCWKIALFGVHELPYPLAIYKSAAMCLAFRWFLIKFADKPSELWLLWDWYRIAL